MNNARTWVASAVIVNLLGCATTNDPHPHSSGAEKIVADQHQHDMNRALSHLSSAVEAFTHASTKTSTLPDYLAAGDVFISVAAVLDPSAPFAANELRQTAKTVHLAPSIGAADERGKAVDAGVTQILSAVLAAVAPQSHRQEFQRAVAMLGAHVDKLKTARPIPEQARLEAAAFRAASDALFLTNGGEPPFEIDDDEPSTPGVQSTSALDDSVEHARDQVGALGRAKWATARVATSQCLSAFADIVAAAPNHEKRKDDIANMRFQAQRLKQSESIGFGQSKWVKAGLVSALDSLRALESSHESVWTRSASLAVAGIDDDESLTFQRAAIQDSFRATLDAFAVELVRHP